MQSPQSENRMSMRVCHIRHTLFLSFSMVAYFFLSAMQLPLAVNSMHCNCSHWPLQTRMFCVSLPCVFMRNNYFFCLVLEINLTLKEPFLLTNRTPCCKKNDSREGLFRCKKGWHVNVGKMNIYLNSLPFAPFSGLFGAKWSVFWCKMECVLVLNGVRFGAKCKVKYP